ncbi:SMP-30/gluconolactonase/LRE family protein [Candidatus Laterigemmans baculatus]|uniref:SMP-30/gluconolactonase/LRE family protein n=1 Tax=Candidatus Laterigemmans baculatus TaxID=2770505 RepID=UPI0013D92D10|nr:SMP-30/gluconolactonase/LRE family protein [Candidatus Laterigemmans baculatus]
MTVRTEATVLHRPSDAALRFLPEGPYPLGPSRISWVAIQHGADATSGSLNILDLASGENSNYPLPGRPGFAFPCDDGARFLVGCEREIGLFHPPSGDWQLLIDGIDADVEGTIINDAVIFEDDLIFGTKDLEFATRKAGLYLYRGRDKKLIRLRDDQICSNGKAIRQAPHGLELIDIDSPTRKIVAYPLDIERGKLGEPHTVVDLTSDSSAPDGAILTPDGGGVIVSMYNPGAAPAGETREYSLRDGCMRRVWLTPGAPQNTCPNLVQHEGRVQLVITTAVEHMPVERQSDAPQSGCLFIAPTEFDSVGTAPAYPP